MPTFLLKSNDQTNDTPAHPGAAPDESVQAQARAEWRVYLAQHPDDEIGWYNLSLVAGDAAEGLECQVRVLEIRAERPGLPGKQTALAGRLRRLADRVERPPAGRWTNVQRGFNWAGHALLAAVALVVALVIGPLALGDRPVVIISGSMEPFFHTGSIVVARPVPADSLRVGDVIAYLPTANAAIPLVHRIVNIHVQDGVKLYTTRGDANHSNDPDEVPLTATAWRYWYSVPLAGYIEMYAGSRNGQLTLLGVPLLGLLALTVLDQVKRWRVRPPTTATRPQ